MLKVYEGYAEFDGKRITHWEALVILAKALAPMNRALNVEDGYTHYDLAMALKYNVVDVEVEGVDLDE